MSQSALLLIPARYGSARFPGKPLASIAGKSMIERVWRRCEQAVQKAKSEGLEMKAVVVTDDERIEDHLKSFGGEVCRIDDDVPSGSERIRLAFERFYSDKKWSFLVNVQGDEPLISPDSLCRLITSHAQSDFDVMTMVKPQIGHGDEFFDPNRVKVVYSQETGKCFYFSRSPIPHSRDDQRDAKAPWSLHVGVYSYRPEALESFCKGETSALENLEKLEQLRGMEQGLKFGAIEVHDQLIGVDTPEDIKKVEGVLSECE